MSVGLTAEIEGDLAAIAALNALEHLDEDELLTAIGAEGEQQSRRRIEEEKTGPDGSPWPKNWGGTPTLMRTGRNLRDSLAYNVLSGAVEWGASWEWAHVHQDGMVITPRYGQALKFWFVQGGHVQFVTVKSVTIPPRPFIGLSDANKRELVEVVTDFLHAVIGGAA